MQLREKKSGLEHHLTVFKKASFKPNYLLKPSNTSKLSSLIHTDTDQSYSNLTSLVKLLDGNINPCIPLLDVVYQDGLAVQ